jgi:hypothetical protein
MTIGKPGDDGMLSGMNADRRARDGRAGTEARPVAGVGVQR